jgi:hypothetical protein
MRDKEFLRWIAQYNRWRISVGWPKMVWTSGLQGGYYQARQGALDHEEPFPTWDMLTAGAKAAQGWGFVPGSAGWLFGPRGTTDKNALRVARWGRNAEAVVDETPDVPIYSERNR